MRSQPNLHRGSLHYSKFRYHILHGYQEMGPQMVVRTVILRATSVSTLSSELRNPILKLTVDRGISRQLQIFAVVL